MTFNLQSEDGCLNYLCSVTGIDISDILDKRWFIKHDDKVYFDARTRDRKFAIETSSSSMYQKAGGCQFSLVEFFESSDIDFVMQPIDKFQFRSISIRDGQFIDEDGHVYNIVCDRWNNFEGAPGDNPINSLVRFSVLSESRAFLETQVSDEKNGHMTFLIVASNYGEDAWYVDVQKMIISFKFILGDDMVKGIDFRNGRIILFPTYTVKRLGGTPNFLSRFELIETYPLIEGTEGLIGPKERVPAMNLI